MFTGLVCGGAACYLTGRWGLSIEEVKKLPFSALAKGPIVIACALLECDEKLPLSDRIKLLQKSPQELIALAGELPKGITLDQLELGAKVCLVSLLVLEMINEIIASQRQTEEKAPSN